MLARGIHLYRLPSLVVVAGGMGAARAALAFEAALAFGPVNEVFSVGLAGACTSALAAGVVAEAALVIDPRTGERFGAVHDGSGQTLVSVETIAGVHEKARLAAAYGAGLVDMEAATVARLAQAHGVAFRAIKGISDPHDFELLSLGRFAGPHGSFRTRSFALHTAVRPAHWRKAAQLGRDSNRALTALWARVHAITGQTS